MFFSQLNYLLAAIQGNQIFPTKDDLDQKIHGSTVNSINRVLKKSLKSHEDYVKKYDEQEINSLYRVIKRIKLIVLVVKTYERAFYLFETTKFSILSIIFNNLGKRCDGGRG